jgi:hypothetical protein
MAKKSIESLEKDRMEIMSALEDSDTPQEAKDGLKEALANIDEQIKNASTSTAKAKAPKKRVRKKGTPNPTYAKIQQIAKDLKAKNPNLKHTDAVRDAWVVLRSEKGTPAPKKEEAKAPESKPVERKKIDKLKVTAKAKETAKKAVVKKPKEAPKKESEAVKKAKRLKAKVSRVGKTYSYKVKGEMKTFTRDKDKDGNRTAMHVGKRVSKDGNVYYEYRDNRADTNIGKPSYKRPNMFARGGGIPKSYTHFVVRKSDGKIINGYDYKGVDAGDIKYFTSEDFKDMGISNKEFSLLTKQSLMSKGIDPFNASNWTNQFAKGGSVDDEAMYSYPDFFRSQGGIKFDTEQDAMNFIKSGAPFLRKALRTGEAVIVFDGEQFYIAEKVKYAKGGVLSKSDLEDFNEWMEDGNVIKNPDGTFSTQDANFKNRIESLEGLKKYYKREFVGSYAKGGMVDLFEDYENIPPKIVRILEKYEDAFDGGDYKGLSMALGEVEENGYTFEYNLWGEAYGLRPKNVPLNKLEGYEDEEYARGGETKGKVTLIFGGKSHSYPANFVDGKVDEVFLDYDMESELFEFIENEFMDWIEHNKGRDIEDMYYSEDAIYSKKGAITGSIEDIAYLMESENKKVLNLDKDESDLSSTWYAKGGRTASKSKRKVVRKTATKPKRKVDMSKVRKYWNSMDDDASDRYEFLINAGFDDSEANDYQYNSWGSLNTETKTALYKTYKSMYADGGEMEDYDPITNARMIGRDSQDYETMLKEYSGEHYKSLTPMEREQIIEDMKRDFDRRNQFAQGGRTDVNKDVTSTLSRLQPYLDEYTMRKYGFKANPEEIFVEYSKRPDGSAQITAVTIDSPSRKQSKKIFVDDIFETFARGGKMTNSYPMKEEIIVS